MRALFRFLLTLDAGAWRAALVSGGLFVAIAAVFAAGRLGWLPDYSVRILDELRNWADGPFGPLSVGMLFLAGAFLGVPQFVLIGASVGVFGPLTGAIHAWAATLFSAVFTFFVGRWGGAETLARFGGPGIARLTQLVARNGFMAAFLIRNAPSAPFIVVNMVMGAARVGTASFTLGTALGIIPKIALIALAGGTLTEAAKGALGAAAVLALLAGAVWISIVFHTRARMQRELMRGEANPKIPGARDRESADPAVQDQVPPPR